MLKIAVYGKGGIGKSTTVSNIAAVLAQKGLKVLQIGCDPKADSTSLLHHDQKLTTILDLVRSKKNVTLEDMICTGYADVICAETGGPAPGMGCAGRGIITALETLQKKGIYETYQPDVVLYDVLGDVVCGGFSMPMRDGYADQVFIITSGENMAIYAAANIAMAVQHFQERNYAQLGGIILNQRNVKNELKKVQELCKDLNTSLIGTLSRSKTVQESEELHQTVIQAFPDSNMAEEYRSLTDQILEACQKNSQEESPC
ncbi:MAG: AAA family ATPase [Oscillospiraceae bacterium]|nr:AAA family ATPase [Oscillospiraceae bacterium]